MYSIYINDYKKIKLEFRCQYLYNEDRKMTNCERPRSYKAKTKKLKTNLDTRLIDLIYREQKESRQFVSGKTLAALAISRHTPINSLKTYGA